MLEATRLSEGKLGAYLRREGLHEAELKEWIGTAMEALSPAPKRKNKVSWEAERIRELEKDLRRKEKALAEVTGLLALKKLEEIWGDEDDDTSTRSGT